MSSIVNAGVPDWLISANRAIAILAPRNSVIPERVGSEFRDAALYREMLGRVQRLRGSIYREDEAIREEELTPDGRHVSPVDEHAWHVLAVESGGIVRGCARYLAHDPGVSFPELVVKNSALARDAQWGTRLRRAVEGEISIARSLGLAYAEVGGWAIDRSIRMGTEALRIALSTYALSRRLGGCIGLTTATVRHHSATTLQRIGGSFLESGGEPLPYYYDPQYRCEMAILKFRSAQADSRFEKWISCLEVQLRTVPVIYSEPAVPIYIPERQLVRSAVA
jgi:hypothetical protein